MGMANEVMFLQKSSLLNCAKYLYQMSFYDPAIYNLKDLISTERSKAECAGWKTIMVFYR
jgi:hypothetical protein